MAFPSFLDPRSSLSDHLPPVVLCPRSPSAKRRTLPRPRKNPWVTHPGHKTEGHMPLTACFLLPSYLTVRSSNLKSPFPKVKVQWHNSQGPLQKSRLHKTTFTKGQITFFVRYGIFTFQMQGDRLLQGEDTEGRSREVVSRERYDRTQGLHDTSWNCDI